ncbi:MAG: hypothetical protein LQ346_002609 [Caloplaca aetnensis]|nr:MAG: hypothetical protein LQ346_002609 [Caloplaca aetnensis]
MASFVVNVLLTTFNGLGLPPTLSVPVSSSISASELRSILIERLPQSHHRLTFTTTSNKELSSWSNTPLSDLLTKDDTIFPIRLTLPLCGGKGGFGSQLRAAGGRMSSKRKRNQGDENSSNRNLDGRRLRTVAEAKALAEYLAFKPEMEKKEKEARRKRWEQVVELAEKREEEIKNGFKGKVDGKWVEDKDDAGEKTREAVVAAMKSGNYPDVLNVSHDARSEDGLPGSGPRHEGESLDASKSKAPSLSTRSTLSCSFFGFDEEEDMSSDGDDGAKEHEMVPRAPAWKGQND